VRGPRARRTPFEGGGDPRARCICSREAWALERGGPRSSGRFAGPLRWAAGATAAWIVLCVYFALGPRLVLRFAFFAGFKQDPRFFRGPSWLSPTVAPEHLQVFRSGSRRCWSLLIGCSSPWLQMLLRGAASVEPRA
jgi:hypothetical protein